MIYFSSLPQEWAHKLWLWYNYHAELYDSKVCTGSNKYEEFTPRTPEERRLININAKMLYSKIANKRRELKEFGVNISDKVWQAEKMSFGHYKLKALEEEYNYYLKEGRDLI